jgi:hypothetical protein
VREVKHLRGGASGEAAHPVGLPLLGDTGYLHIGAQLPLDDPYETVDHADGDSRHRADDHRFHAESPSLNGHPRTVHAHRHHNSAEILGLCDIRLVEAPE